MHVGLLCNFIDEECVCVCVCVCVPACAVCCVLCLNVLPQLGICKLPTKSSPEQAS